MHSESPSIKAVLLVSVCAFLWGLYWVPVHALNNQGFLGAWTSIFLALSALLVTFPLVLALKPRMPEMRCLIGSLGIGAAFSLYGIAISYSDVVRVVLLFYLAPAWSTIIECVFFARRWSWRSVLGLLLSFIGIIVLFRGEIPTEGIGALGDWMALFAGLCWSLGSALMFSSRRIDVLSMTFASFLSAVLISGLCLVIFGGSLELPDDVGARFIYTTVGIGMLLGAVYLLPVTYVTLWGATRIPPALMSFLLTLEVIAAVATSAWYLGIRFGLVEILGTALIISGALTEVFKTRQLPT